MESAYDERMIRLNVSKFHFHRWMSYFIDCEWNISEIDCDWFVLILVNNTESKGLVLRTTMDSHCMIILIRNCNPQGESARKDEELNIYE